MLKFFTKNPNHFSLIDSEYKLSGFIPYLYHLDEKTVYTKDNQLLQVIKVGGFSFETADDDDVDIKKNIRNFLFKGMADPSINLYFHIIRKKQDVYQNLSNNVDMPDGFANYLDKKWIEKHKYHKGFSNELYVTVSYKVKKNLDISFLEDIAAKFRKTGKKQVQNDSMVEGFEQLQESSNRIANSLRQYNPKVLGVVERNGQRYSEIAEFFSSILNCGNPSNVLLGSGKLDRLLMNSRMYFGKRAIEIKCLVLQTH
jgi:type IV secretion system protein VirB4